MDAWLRDEAREELRQAAVWYEHQRPGLGGEFLDDFLAAIESIESDPELHVEVDEGIRRALFRRFPYAMFYSIEPDHLQILAIKHTHGDPAKWPTRA